MKNRTVLLWCREPEWCSAFSSRFLKDVGTLIPVFCFDPRESNYFPDKSGIENRKSNLKSNLEVLRKELKSRGSDLIITNGLPENIIPSYARVLKVDAVITCIQASCSKQLSPEHLNFQSDVMEAVTFHLKMHSIDFSVVDDELFSLPSRQTLPTFPGIKTGSL